MLQDIRVALQQGQLRNGKNLKRYEKTFAKYIGVGNAVAFDSDQSAFETALHYYGIKGMEVVVSTNSFISVPNSVVTAGGKVVFADIGADTLSMDLGNVKKKLSDRTAGVIVTHIAGFPNPHLNEIAGLCKEKGLFLIEDATHAVGATVKGRKMGTFGDSAVFASTPTKPMTTGEGGMLLTDHRTLAEEARLFSYYGSGPGKTNFVNLGRHMMLPEISAILGVYQMKHIEEFITMRNDIADIYNGIIDKSRFMRRVRCAADSRSSYYKYPLILAKEVDVKQFTQSLNQAGIETGSVFYPPNHMQNVYKNKPYSDNTDLTTAETVLPRTITLPMHVALTRDNAKFIMDSCISALEGQGLREGVA
jgi:dTDP-4-amino-4,6-dideoxygalactose transaminase